MHFCSSVLTLASHQREGGREGGGGGGEKKRLAVTKIKNKRACKLMLKNLHSLAFPIKVLVNYQVLHFVH